jgi:hypothetical protein
LQQLGWHPGRRPRTAKERTREDWEARVVRSASKGRKDRNVMLPEVMLGLLRQWWKARPSRHDAGRRISANVAKLAGVAELAWISTA